MSSSESMFVELDKIVLSINDEVVVTIVGHEAKNDYQTFVRAKSEIIEKSMSSGKFELLAVFSESWFKNRGHAVWIDPHFDQSLIRRVIVRIAVWVTRIHFERFGIEAFK